MSIVNLAECTTTTGNTGVSACWLDIKVIKGIIVVPEDFAVEPANYASKTALISYLQNLTLATTATRIYPIINFIDIEDGSEDDVINTSGYGNDQVVRTGKYKWNFRYSDGGMCLNKNLHKLFNNKKSKVLLVDADYQIIGTKVGDNIEGLTAGNIDPKKVKVATGSEPAMYNISVELTDPKELNENFAIVKLDNSPATLIKGLLNVDLTTSNEEGAGVDVQALVGCQQLNLYDYFADELADTDAWVVKNSVGGLVTVSAVTKNALAKTWTVACTLANGTYTIELAPALTLSALGVGVPPANGYESEVKSFTIAS